MRICVWLLVLCFGASLAAAITPVERLHETIDAMESAISEGDLGAYMAQVDTHDGLFATEQRAWFTDFDRNPVSEISIEFEAEPEFHEKSDDAVVPIKITWVLSDDGIERWIRYRARFVPVAEPDGAWLFAGRGWEVILVGDTGLRVFANKQHEELATQVLEVVPDIRRAIEKDLGRTLTHPLTIKLYPTVADLQQSISLGYLNMLSGWNEPGESIKVLGREDIHASRLSSLLAHEIGHAVSFEYGPKIIEAPWWSLEGIAELVSDPYRSTPVEDRALGIANLVERGDRRSWEQLSDFKGEAVNHSMYVYSQGWSMVRYVSNRYGRKERNKWFAAMGRGHNLDSATMKVLGISFEDLDRAWESELVIMSQQSKCKP